MNIHDAITKDKKRNTPILFFYFEAFLVHQVKKNMQIIN